MKAIREKPNHPIRTKRRKEGDDSSPYCFDNDNEIEDRNVSAISASFLAWKKSAGSHLHSVYCSSSQINEMAKKSLDKSNQPKNHRLLQIRELY